MPDTATDRLRGGFIRFSTVACCMLASCLAQAKDVSPNRLTPLVQAVRMASPSVVNIQGQKTVADMASGPNHDGTRQVNGMGTGVVIDPRGYILTNHHVVDGVKQINVTFADRRKYVAKIVAFDPRTDLAVIRVRTSHLLPVIQIGTSSDLMPAESVVAVGNAFGYEHTVTVGIVSALHRDVQVSETQSYDDLIQTDASINPGNSGGPLLNVDGQMIGVNVAVRAGAQGIGFAIPVDAAMEVAARLIGVEETENRWHGLTLRTNPAERQVVVENVANGSPAAEYGFRTGDVITQVGDVKTERRLDVERALLGTNAALPVVVDRDGKDYELRLAAESIRTRRTGGTRQLIADRSDSWETLGVELEPEPASTFAGKKSQYRGGLRITEVRPNSPAQREGLEAGDILVGLHKWQTASLDDVDYILTKSSLPRMSQVRFYIVRNNETLYTDVNVASVTTRNTVRR
ncbi:trypsin-like peptidase domain-containing protein [Aeoliella sp. ICT_H6.2]|uniref:Trypsin-like peptidase domain-containing protein n=1 Tax=Aeoliella straminimaris TaxID=2954799 RepID=A0A9X2JJ74_9BACT|nr:trypsin-like peptidase domain-containing protein [Aeoliella straminimaris]MCO6047875.1 trypsin-like peptidase domain-containing protein [Aeoliella straminimaris]